MDRDAAVFELVRAVDHIKLALVKNFMIIYQIVQELSLTDEQTHTHTPTKGHYTENIPPGYGIAALVVKICNLRTTTSIPDLGRGILIIL